MRNQQFQMSSYTTPLRKTTKWPKRLAMELLLNTAIVNSYILYKLITKKLSVVQFRTALVEYLVNTGVPETSASIKPRRVKHREGKGWPLPVVNIVLGVLKKSVPNSEESMLEIKPKEW